MHSNWISALMWIHLMFSWIQTRIKTEIKQILTTAHYPIQLPTALYNLVVTCKCTHTHTHIHPVVVVASSHHCMTFVFRLLVEKLYSAGHSWKTGWVRQAWRTSSLKDVSPLSESLLCLTVQQQEPGAQLQLHDHSTMCCGPSQLQLW